MIKMEDDVNGQDFYRTLSRARQRKIKREQPSGASSHNGAGLNRRSDSRQRKSRRTGPSVRERLAASHINFPSPSIHSLQRKISSTLRQTPGQADKAPSSERNILSGLLSTTKRNRQKSESRRGESLFEATPRAETQRKSNENHACIPRKNRRIYDARTETAPPVMVRGGMGGMAFGRVATSRLHKQKPPRRRFDIPLKVQGAEVRLPSVPFINIGWRAVSLLLVLMMAGSLFLIWKSPVFQVKAVEAEGLKRLTVGDLNTVLGTFGASIFSINPQGLEQIVQQAFPELEKISVKVNLPANINVAVVEREPVIAWIQEGSELWVDAKGVAFRPRGNPEKPLVKVEGYGTPPGTSLAAAGDDQQFLPANLPDTPARTAANLSLSPELVSAILALGAKVPADTLLVYDSEHGLGWNDPGGWEVFFGQEDQDMEMKLSVYETLVQHLQSEGIQPELISVEYVHAPYYRMER
jgi:hypothetical protein